jgi:hypothetical protein
LGPFYLAGEGYWLRTWLVEGFPVTPLTTMLIIPAPPAEKKDPNFDTIILLNKKEPGVLLLPLRYWGAWRPSVHCWAAETRITAPANVWPGTFGRR